jgi:hypothetical protein
MKITIECNCGNVFKYEGRFTFDVREDNSDLDIFMNNDDNIVFECEHCQDKIRFVPRRYD